MTSRENILHRVRTALGRSAGQPPAEPPAVRLRPAQCGIEERVSLFRRRVEALAGRTADVGSAAEAREYVLGVLGERTAIASNSPILAEYGILQLPGVRSGVTDRDELRRLCATADVGITSADYALAETGTLVLFSSPEEARMISLLPPVHLALLPRERLLGNLDELFQTVADPAARSSSMVLITGPSRTADIEQILVRGVHGPGEIHVVVV